MKVVMFVAVVLVLVWAMSGGGDEGSQQKAVSPRELAESHVRKAEQGHIYAAQPDGIVGDPTVKANCPRARAGREFECTARLQLALPGTDKKVTLAEGPWRVRLTPSSAIARAQRKRAAISRFAQADARLDCVGQFIDGLVSGSATPNVVAVLLPCQQPSR